MPKMSQANAQAKSLQIFLHLLTNSECESIKGGFIPGVLEMGTPRPVKCDNDDDYAPGC